MKILFCSLCVLLGLLLDGNRFITAFSTPLSFSRVVHPQRAAVAAAANVIMRAKSSEEASASGADATTKSLVEQEQLQIAFVTGNKMKVR